ncbi:MAG TPA: ROK family protein, partial [Candidatus Sulfotelmatobacter sp.]|nr:ROK family protein [Candidatus Sulfotelmatobacter sp.]
MIDGNFARANGITGKVTYVFSLGDQFIHGIFHNSGNVTQVKNLGLGRTFPPEMVVGFIKSAVPKVGVKAIGIAVAGPVHNGAVASFPNGWGPGVRDFPLAKELRKIFNVPIEIVNNGTARLLFEKRYGHAKFLNSVGLVVVDRGAGLKLFSNGRVIVGPDGQDGEIGHFTVANNSHVICGCGEPD